MLMAVEFCEICFTGVVLVYLPHSVRFSAARNHCLATFWNVFAHRLFGHPVLPLTILRFRIDAAKTKIHFQNLIFLVTYYVINGASNDC